MREDMQLSRQTAVQLDITLSFGYAEILSFPFHTNLLFASG